MTFIFIVMFVFGIIALFIGLLLSSSGSTTNLLSSGGQDLELFKKTKDRGFIKFLQIAMFVVSLTLIICGFIAMMINKK
ncbi:preprotein translocase subunit SecG [bacterium]|nr:preprotein translocase subunit SecG [bacterium]